MRHCIIFFCLLSLISLQSFAGEESNAAVFLAVPGYEKKIGIPFNQDAVEMVALYRGNNLYLLPFTWVKKRLIGSDGKAVTPEPLSIPKMVEEEVRRGKQSSTRITVLDKKFAKETDTFFIQTKNGEAYSGKFKRDRGDINENGVALFTKEGEVHIYQISHKSDKISISFHILSSQQYKAAKKRVRKKLQTAGHTSAAKKMEGMQ